MSESYGHVIKGGLKLKGGGTVAAGGVGKKKKGKKSKKEVRECPRLSPPQLVARSSLGTTNTTIRRPNPTPICDPVCCATLDGGQCVL